MRLALLILAVVVLLWLVRGAVRRRAAAQRPEPTAATAASDATSPQPMLTCAHCGLHLPRDEALPGRGGVFCGDAHRKAFEQTEGGT